MTAAAIALGLAAPVLVAFLVMRRLCPAEADGRSTALQASLALGMGVGASSLSYYVWRLLVGPPRLPYVVADAACWLVAAAVLFAIGPRRGSRVCGGTLRASSLLLLALGAALAVAVGVFLVCFATEYRLSPHGDWDAWVIWNCRARFLDRAGPDWAYTFSPIGWHSDYPLLLPSAVARLWAYAGNETTVAPAAVALAFALGTIGTLVSSVALLRGLAQGLIAGIVLLGYRQWMRAPATQLADVPLGFFMLATVVLLALRDRAPEQGIGAALLAGGSAGFAAWTKNEGLLFLLVVAASRLAFTGWNRAFRRHEVAAFAFGALVPLGALASFKSLLAPTNDLVGGQGIEETLARLTDGSRYALVGRAFIGYLAMIGPGLLALLVAYALLVGFRSRSAGRPAATTGGLVLALMLAGYVFVYVTTPREPLEHVANSLGRLLVQLWPLGLFAFFLAVPSPDDAPPNAR